jgi:hypothetical protein
MSETKWNEIEESLKQGYYGNVTFHCLVGATQLRLYETNIADPDENECGWECAEWYLVSDDGQDTIVARCDGYTGVKKQIKSDELCELLGYSQEEWADEQEECFWEKINPYQITGELISDAKSEQLDDAEEGYVGECAIWETPNYYIGHINAPTADFIADDNGERLIFSSHAEAQAYLDEDDGPYYCSHGEAGRPSYRIVKYQ